MLDFGIASIPLFIMLLFYGLIIYLLISLIRFMNNKIALDQERNEKLDQLIQLLQKGEQKEPAAPPQSDHLDTR
ncbi:MULTISPECIES: hypothetical protein [Brevibacillus]|jgi:uncharacterized iron-regulated membrane protein|uniref:DUF4083 domain-containing protein n=1 Tax=Brevibacillus parabrevis TaxID=54914 RepID=A0A4Y3PMZ3_BREPA|nr:MULTISPECIES: hypothetical protein [Brevibacillus]MDH6351312.1 putative iron-regulated membrane protein [Brevibacillus sp. 1238]MED2254824.1 hypothetical protein [Brevibacillus parabrevis]RNB95630.1 hypothetical protein EDM60_10375 [Brevibacillus parabrevis]UED67677.1 hypothetical protein HP435_20715 [Brevibacillus sp. HD3.3A]GEB34235.1 hypothetical protein BPA01_38150 [Brevibacillus parabrevis]